jgi:ubiquinone/menaquinone biosynthesis C-methylase UbiE
MALVMDMTVNLVKPSNETQQTSDFVVPLAATATSERFPSSPRANSPEIPAYLRDVYYWAYLNPRNVRLLDRELVVEAILWGQHRRLRETALAELEPGQTILQPACVYGEFSPALAKHLGPRGCLEIIDVAPIQVAACRRKLLNFPQAMARRADARWPGNGHYDAVCCYFLLHELPEDCKRAVVDSLLGRVGPGGKVVFVDYHKPHWAHPLKAVTSLVFDTLEPFAKDLWHQEIKEFASNPDPYDWRKETYFGGLFQKVVAQRAVGSTAPRRRTRREYDGEPREGG